MATPAPAQRLDLLHGPVQVDGALLVDDQRIRAGLGEGLEELVRVFDHQVNFQRQLRHRPEALDDRRTEGQVGNEVAVHHVHVNAIGPPCSAALTCSASRDTSAERMEGASLIAELPGSRNHPFRSFHKTLATSSVRSSSAAVLEVKRSSSSRIASRIASAPRLHCDKTPLSISRPNCLFSEFMASVTPSV